MVCPLRERGRCTNRLVVSLEAKIDQFEKQLDRANGVANTRMGQIEKRFRKANVNVMLAKAYSLVTGQDLLHETHYLCFF